MCKFLLIQLLQSASAGLHHQVHHPTRLVHIVASLIRRVPQMQQTTTSRDLFNLCLCVCVGACMHICSLASLLFFLIICSLACAPARVSVLFVNRIVFLDHLLSYVRACTCVCSLCEQNSKKGQKGDCPSSFRGSFIVPLLYVMFSSHFIVYIVHLVKLIALRWLS